MKSGATAIYIEQKVLLSQKINELPLKINAAHLRERIFQLYRELERVGIALKPKTYLSNGWGCPNKIPVIGIPFYLADPTLSKLQTQMTGEKTEDNTSIMKLLRHEAGHTFNYAYRLYDKLEWQDVFGPFSLPYQDEYKVDPSSNRFVHHLAGYYAQKHPDDDFAETFAVWLTPDSNWKKVYAGTPALEKLRYVNRVVSKYGEKSPIVTGGKLDMPVNEMGITLSEWFRMVYKNRDKRAARLKLRTQKC